MAKETESAVAAESNGKLELNAELRPNKTTKEKGITEAQAMSIEIDWPVDYDDAKSRWGEEVCFKLISGAAKVSAQGVLRRLMLAGKTEAQCEQYFANVNAFSEDPNAPVTPWAPSVSPVRKSSMQKLIEGAKSLNPEQLAIFLKGLEASE